MLRSKRWLAISAALVLAGCHPSPPPVTSLEGRDCATKPQLDAAPLIPFGKPKGLVTLVDRDFPCLTLPGGARASYAAFRLPEANEPMLMTVASAALSGFLLPPVLWLLDANGAKLREVGFRAFQPNGYGMQVFLRLKPAETSAVVLSDPSLVGRKGLLRYIGELGHDPGAYQVASMIFIPSYIPAPPGPRERHVEFVYSGSITAAVTPVPRAP